MSLISEAPGFRSFEGLDGPAIESSWSVSDASLSESSSFMYRFQSSWSTGGGILSQ